MSSTSSEISSVASPSFTSRSIISVAAKFKIADSYTVRSVVVFGFPSVSSAMSSPLPRLVRRFPPRFYFRAESSRRFFARQFHSLFHDQPRRRTSRNFGQNPSSPAVRSLQADHHYGIFPNLRFNFPNCLIIGP